MSMLDPVHLDNQRRRSFVAAVLRFDTDHLHAGDGCPAAEWRKFERVALLKFAEEMAACDDRRRTLTRSPVSVRTYVVDSGR